MYRKSAQAIAESLVGKIAPHDVLLVYSRPTVVEEALLHAHAQVSATTPARAHTGVRCRQRRSACI